MILLNLVKISYKIKQSSLQYLIASSLKFHILLLKVCDIFEYSKIFILLKYSNLGNDPE